MPYTLHVISLTKRRASSRTVEAGTAADALRQRQKLIATDHVVTLIEGPDGRRVAPADLEQIAKRAKPEAE